MHHQGEICLQSQHSIAAQQSTHPLLLQQASVCPLRAKHLHRAHDAWRETLHADPIEPALHAFPQQAAARQLGFTPSSRNPKAHAAERCMLAVPKAVADTSSRAA